MIDLLCKGSLIGFIFKQWFFVLAAYGNHLITEGGKRRNGVAAGGGSLLLKLWFIFLGILPGESLFLKVVALRCKPQALGFPPLPLTTTSAVKERPMTVSAGLSFGAAWIRLQVWLEGTCLLKPQISRKKKSNNFIYQIPRSGVLGRGSYFSITQL